jgi:HK97 family phage prohead protease
VVVGAGTAAADIRGRRLMAGQSEEAAVTESIHVRRLQGLKDRTAARIITRAQREGLGVADLATVRLPWYAISNQAEDLDEPATVWIYDEVGGSFGVEAEQFARDLDEIQAKEILVRVNSPGGSVFDGIAIYNSLRQHPARIVVSVDSLAASIASVIAMAGDEVRMHPGSQMMIHDALGIERGQAADMAKMSTFLDRQSDNIAGIYRRKAGGMNADWRDLMLAETWMFADETVEFGLADVVVDDDPPAPPDAEVQERMAHRHDLRDFRHAGRRAAPPPRRRTAVKPEKRTEGVMPVTMARSSSDAERRQAATARTAAAGDRTGRVARRVAPVGVGAARMAGFPAQMRAELVEYNGQRRYHLQGHASVVEQPYEMWDSFGPYMEVIERGAFDRTLAAGPDVAFLVNHRGVTMARTTNDSLRLEMDETGLKTDAWLNPKRQDVTDLVTAIEDKDVTEMSFAFMLDDGAGRWNEDFTEFRIGEADIDRGDVSAVNYGANPYTDVSARSREVLADLDHLPAGAARAAVARLQARADVAGTNVADRMAELEAPTTPVEPQHGRSIAHMEALLEA